MAEHRSGVWRDDKRLPLSELDRALATYSQDGQVDLTGEDAGTEAEFRHEPEALATPAAEGDPDPTTEEGRRLRPSPDGTTPGGRSGPH